MCIFKKLDKGSGLKWDIPRVSKVSLVCGRISQLLITGEFSTATVYKHVGVRVENVGLQIGVDPGVVVKFVGCGLKERPWTLLSVSFFRYGLAPNQCGVFA